MEKSFGLFFYLRKRKWFKKGDEINIYLRITVDKKSTEISAKRKCLDERWNSVAGRVEGKTEYAKSTNAWLDVLQRFNFDGQTKRTMEV